MVEGAVFADIATFAAVVVAVAVLSRSRHSRILLSQGIY